MLKRTIVVLAVLSMLVGLLPAVALAAGGDVNEVRLTVSRGAAHPNVDVTMITDNPNATADFEDIVSGVCNYCTVAVAGDYNGAAAGTPGAASGSLADFVVDDGTTTYYFYDVALVEQGNLGIAVVSLALPASGSISGDVLYDFDQNPDLAATPGVEGFDDRYYESDTMISVYKSGVLWATQMISDGDFTILTGTGAGFTVKTDIEQESATLIGVDLGSDDSDDGVLNTVTTTDDLDGGEILWFANGASFSVTGAMTNVDFLYENETDGKNHFQFDHVDVQMALKFKDMIGHWAEEEAAAVFGWGLVVGCTADNYCPEADITRAEFAAILGRGLALWGGLGLPVVTTAPFSDVPASHWAAAWIAILKADKVVVGDGSGNFNPDANVTRDEAAAMLARALFIIADWGYTDKSVPANGVDPGDLPTPTLSFIDVPITHWAAKEITWLFGIDVFGGNKNGTFGPTDNLSRAEMAAIVHRAGLAWMALP
jgi:hypothetical protein